MLTRVTSKILIAIVFIVVVLSLVLFPSVGATVASSSMADYVVAGMWRHRLFYTDYQAQVSQPPNFALRLISVFT